MKIGFLLNHYDSHQVPHIVPYAFKLSELYPDAEVIILSSTEEQKDFAKKISSDYRNQRCKFIDVKASLIIELIDPILSKIVFARKSAVIRKNIALFSSFDALVVPEVTSLSLKKHPSFKDVKLIFTGHGSGDNENLGSYDKRLSEFDLCLLPGQKYAKGLTEHGFLRHNNFAISGYPKFEAVRALPHKPIKLFKNSRPTIVYNPHHHPSYSSWPLLGEDILEYFYNNQNFNFIFAPHVLLFKRKWGKGFKLPSKYQTTDNIIIDPGSRRSVDMTYMRAADLYLGDCSSQIYEFLAHPRPCVFLNTLGIKTDRPTLPYYCWNFGPIVDRLEDLGMTINTALADQSNYIDIQKRAFTHTFEINDISSAERGARIIEEFTRTGKVDQKWV